MIINIFVTIPVINHSPLIINKPNVPTNKYNSKAIRYNHAKGVFRSIGERIAIIAAKISKGVINSIIIGTIAGLFIGIRIKNNEPATT
jgi:hypothetical protein